MPIAMATSAQADTDGGVSLYMTRYGKPADPQSGRHANQGQNQVGPAGSGQAEGTEMPARKAMPMPPSAEWPTPSPMKRHPLEYDERAQQAAGDRPRPGCRARRMGRR